MAYGKKYTVTVTTNSSGVASFVVPAMNGIINRIAYTKVDFADGVDFAITTEDGVSLWTENNVNASKRVFPEANGGNSHWQIVLADQTVTIGIAEGGNVKSGTFTFFLY
jgi:hypothetical protein